MEKIHPLTCPVKARDLTRRGIHDTLALWRVRISVIIMIAFLMTGSLIAQTTYTWIGANNGSWATAGNWSPTRTTPATTDILQFNSGTTLTITSISTETIGRFVMSNNTNITLQRTTGARTLTIGNGTGIDLDIPSGSTLTIGTNVNITLGSSATATISGSLTVNASRTFNTNGTSVVTTVNGTLTANGTVTCTTASKLLFQASATYVHAVNGVTLPTATWNAASTCRITGRAGTALTNLGQSFGNLNYNCTGQTSAQNLPDAGTLSIAGNLEINSTGSSTLQLNQSSISVVNFSQTGGTLNLSVTASQSIMNVSGNFTHTAGTISETSTGSGSIIFNKAGTQTYTSGGTVSNTINFTVNSGSTLQMGTGATPATITGGGTFTLNSGAALGVTSPNGITLTGTASGNIQTTTARNYNTGANYIYNGTAGQVTGTGLTQNTPANLTIDNPATVTLSAATTVSGHVLISQGTLSTSASNYNMTVGGNWTRNGVFTPGTATVTFNGPTPANIGTSNFYNLTIAGPGLKTATGNLSIANDVTINSDIELGNFSHSVAGNWTNTSVNSYGSLGTGASTVTFTGSANKIISGWSYFYNLVINKDLTTNTVTDLDDASSPKTSLHLRNDLTITRGTLVLQGTDWPYNIDNNLAIAANGILTSNVPSTAFPITIKGNWSNNGTYNGGTCAVLFSGTSQSIGGTSTTTFGNLQAGSATGTTLTLAVNAAVAGNLDLLSTGVLDLATYSCNRTTAGGAITIPNGCTLKIGGTGTFPANFTSHVLGSTSTVEYYGTTQTIGADSYGILNITAAGTKTAGGNISASSLDNGGSGNAAAILDMGTNTLTATTIDNTGATIRFNGLTNGKAIGTGTVEYYGTTQTIATGTYNNLNLNTTGTTNTAGGHLTVNGTLNVGSGSTLDMTAYNLTGTLAAITNSGTIRTAGSLPNGKSWNGDVEYYGAGGQTLAGGTYVNCRTLTAGDYVAGGNIIATFFDNGGGPNNAAVLDMLSYEITATTLGNSGATIKFGGPTNGHPATGGGLIVYYGSNQTIGGGQYKGDLTIQQASGNAILGADISVFGTLSMASGNIDCGTYTLTLGESVTNSGTLNRTTGNIIGNFCRWVPGSTATPVDFPVGTASSYQNARVTFGNNTGGTLTVTFEPGDPGNNSGYPLTENSLTIWDEGGQYMEGTWTMVPATLTTTSYNLELTGTGFTTAGTFDSDVRVIKRPDGGGPWVFDGTHIAATGVVSKRTGMTGFSRMALAKPCTNAAVANPGGPDDICQSASPTAYTLSGASVSGSATSGAWSITSLNPANGGVNGSLSSTAQTASPQNITYTPPANYKGTVTLTLTTNNPAGGCKAESAERTLTIGSNQWQGNTSDWNTASNWCGGVPTSGTDVVIQSGVTQPHITATPAACRDLTISSGATVTIDAGNQLTVAGTLSNPGGNSGLVIKSNASATGSLIHATDNVPATVERYIANDLRWHFLASPVASQEIWPEFAPTPTGSPLSFGAEPWNWDFYYWNPNADTNNQLYWVNLRRVNGEYNNNPVNQGGSYAGFGSTTPPQFTVGKGYLAAYDNAWGTTHTFAGQLNNGNISYPVVTGTNSYNLAGNPYPSSIDWKAATGWDRSALALNGSGYDYWIFNDNTGNYGVFNSAGTSGTNGVSRYIAPQQAFFVRATAGGNLGMANDVRTHSTQEWLKEAVADGSSLRLKIVSTANSYSDEMVVEFDPGVAEGGSYKFWSFYQEAPEVWVSRDGGSYSISRYHAPSDGLTVSVAVKPGAGANYTLLADNIQEFWLTGKVWLDDLKTGRTQELKQNPAYAFTGAPGDDPNRFRLRFGGPYGTGDPGDQPAVVIYSFDHSVWIKNMSACVLEGNVYICDLLGRILRQERISGPGLRIPLEIPAGVYIVTLVTDRQTVSQKVVLH